MSFYVIRNILAMAERRGQIGAGGALVNMERVRRLPLDDAGIGGDSRRKSAKAVTGDVLAQMLATCASGSLRDLRDQAILTWRSPPVAGGAARSPDCAGNS